jgi:hypothetical protein
MRAAMSAGEARGVHAVAGAEAQHTPGALWAARTCHGALDYYL